MGYGHGKRRLAERDSGHDMENAKRREINGQFLKFVILSVSLVTMVNNTISVELGSIQEAFPEASTVELQSLLAYPTLSMTIFVLISGVCVSYFGNKIILLTGLFLFTAAGVLPILLDDFQKILASRFVMGMGTGIFFPLALGLITDFYEGEERAAAMGQQFAVGNFGQMSALLATGLLSSISWRSGFLVYALGFPVFLLILFSLPYKPKKQKEEKKKVRISKKAFGVGVIMAFYNMIYLVMYSNVSLVMKAEHIGTAMTVSLSMALMTLISALSGVWFGKLYSVIGEWVGFASGMAVAVSFAMLIIADQPWMIYVALAFLGEGNALIMPYGYYHKSKASKTESKKLSLAVTQALLSLGSFSSPFVIDILRRILSQNGDRFPFTAALAGMGILNTLLLIKCLTARKEGEQKCVF